MKKIFTRLAGGAALALLMGGVSFAQHYTQTNLVSNAAGTPVVDSMLGQRLGAGPIFRQFLVDR